MDLFLAYFLFEPLKWAQFIYITFLLWKDQTKKLLIFWFIACSDSANVFLRFGGARLCILRWLTFLYTQEYGSLSHQKPENLHYILSPWPFVKWGMDITGPFTLGKGQCKFLLVNIDYFTKWIDVEPLAAITAWNVQNFVWKNIVCRFGISHVVITDNSRHFTDQGLAEFYEKLDIKHITSSVEHPQTNGQDEVANKVIINELKNRLGSAKGKWIE